MDLTRCTGATGKCAVLRTSCRDREREEGLGRSVEGTLPLSSMEAGLCWL